MKEILTLENVQVDCRELTEEQIKKMADIYRYKGYYTNYKSLDIIYEASFLSYCHRSCSVYFSIENKTTITYDKFMELFGNKEKSEEFNNLVEVLNEELTEEAFKHCLTPVLDKAIEISENIAYKETSNKLKYELDFNFITQLAERMAQNKHKYEPYNWQKLDNISEIKQALFRHVLEVMNGNYEDDDRLFGHLESIALNAMFINYQLKKGSN